MAETGRSRWSPDTTRVTSRSVATETLESERSPAGSKLTGGQKWVIAGLFVLQVPFGLIFLPLAAVFAITGIFVPVAMVLVGIGTVPVSWALRLRDGWRIGDAAPVANDA